MAPTSDPFPDPFVTTAEATLILHRSTASVARYVAEGRLAVAQKLPGIRGAMLFTRADVETLAAQLTQERAS